MIFIKCDQYGEVIEKIDNESINQNSARVNKIAFAFPSLVQNLQESYNYNTYLTFKRSDNETISDLICSRETIAPYENPNTRMLGFTLLLPASVTQKDGQLQVSAKLVRIDNNETIVTTSKVNLSVTGNATQSGNVDVSISQEQYDALLERINALQLPITILPESYNSIEQDSLVFDQLNDESRPTGWYIKTDGSSLYYFISELDSDSFAVGYNGIKAYLWNESSNTHALSSDIDQVGVLNNLDTTHKDNIVNALNETYQLYTNFNTNVDNRINGKADKTYVDTELNKKSDKLNTYTKSETYSKTETDEALRLKSDKTELNQVNALIPNDASTENKLATRDFVNSSIATNTATFRGTYNSLESLKQATGDANDYAILKVVDEHGNVQYDRYKWVETEVDNSHWVFEYTLNNSSFTEEQYLALNSGITATLLAQILSDIDNVYTIAEIDSSFYTKSQIDSLFYSKTMVDNIIANYSTTSQIADIYCTKAKQKLDSDKALYNLGAYDSVSTSNGITTITRQTGYLSIFPNDYQQGWMQGGNSTTFYINTFISLPLALVENNQYVGVANIIVGEGWARSRKCITLNTNYGNIRIYNNVQSAEGLPIEITLQYKLATSYQEQVIEGQPLNTLDQNESQILKEDIDNGLNLFDVNANGTKNGVSYQATGSAIKLNGTSSVATDLWLKLDNPIPRGTYGFNCENASNCQIFLCKEIDNYTDRIDISNIETTTIDFEATYIIVFFASNKTFSNQEIRIMLNKGTHSYPYVPYNANKHISNAQAELLKDEFDRCSNLLKYNQSISISAGGSGTTDAITGLTLIEGKTYTLSYINSNSNGEIRVWLNGTQNLGNRTGSNSYTFVVSQTLNDLQIVFYDQNNQAQTISNIMLNEGDTALPYQDYEGRVVHLKDLELYGTKPAIANIQCALTFDGSARWNTNSSDKSVGASISELEFGYNKLGYIYCLPTKSTGSLIKAEVEYVGGDTDAFAWSIRTINYDSLEMDCVTKIALRGPASSYGTLKTANYRIKVEDMYGHTFYLPFSVNYKSR